MRLSTKHPRRLLAILTMVLITLATTWIGHAAPDSSQTVSPVSSSRSQHAGIHFLPNGDMQLLAEASPPPPPIQGYERYGLYLSPLQAIENPTPRFSISHQATTPSDTRVRIDVRGSGDGTRWTSWHTDLASEQEVTFAHAVRFVQYRARFFGSTHASPTLHNVAIQEQATDGAQYQVFQQPAEEIVAPTYKVYATREGLVGHRTANGYVIEPNAWFVSLPSWRSLCSKGGYEYQVRITHGDNSIVAPVWDVGPWNTHDDYWSVQREWYNDLPRGWPQDHAAYFEGYNGGYAEKGYVRFPTAIDIGDGAWWALGLTSGWIEVEITFLWLQGDSGQPSAPPVDTATNEFEVRETLHQGTYFHPQAAITWYHSPGGCGEDKHALWTFTTTDPAQSENQAFWQPELTAEKLYDVYVHVPYCPTNHPVTQAARYLVQHRDGAEEIVVNQAQQTGWVLLGRFPFAAGNEGFVHLRDVAGDSMHVLWYDNVKWVPVSDSAGE